MYNYRNLLGKRLRAFSWWGYGEGGAYLRDYILYMVV